MVEKRVHSNMIETGRAEKGLGVGNRHRHRHCITVS
jgi:hypothetical protein